MKNCLHFEELIDGMLDGTITPQEEAALKAHLEECTACKTAFEQDRAVIALLESLPVQSLSSDAVQRIENATVGKRKNRFDSFRLRGRMHLPVWPKFAFGFIAVLVLLFLIRPFIESPQPDSVPVYTETDALHAKKQAKWSLVYISDLLRKTEKRVVSDILLKDMPGTVKKSLEKSLPLLKGGQK